MVHISNHSSYLPISLQLVLTLILFHPSLYIFFLYGGPHCVSPAFFLCFIFPPVAGLPFSVHCILQVCACLYALRMAMCMHTLTGCLGARVSADDKLRISTHTCTANPMSSSSPSFSAKRLIAKDFYTYTYGMLRTVRGEQGCTTQPLAAFYC